MKNYSIDCIEREKITNIRKNKRTKLVIYPTIYLVGVILYTKYEHCILYSCRDIFDEIVEKKKKDIYKEE